MDLMHFMDGFFEQRLLANLIGIVVVLAGIVALSLLLRAFLKHGGDHFARWTGLHGLHSLSQEASQSARRLLFSGTLVLMAATAAGMILYHSTGHDLRSEMHDLSAEMTGLHLLAWGLMAGKLVVLAVAVRVAIRLVRRVRPYLEAHVHARVPFHLLRKDASPPEQTTPAEQTAAQHSIDYEATVCRSCVLLERSALAAVLLAGLWGAGRAIEFSLIDSWVGRLLSILLVLTFARLLTLSCQLISHSLAHAGDRHLNHGPFQRYWEGVTRLFPFGERCFEAAVYIAAASLCVHALGFIDAHYGARVVNCIAIFFGTRVLIELLYVFINQAFGMYEEDRPIDQKGLTLVPLLQSLCQYSLYFGSALMMLEVLGISTLPIMACASILGLAGGLGAQSLVTDVVSGFFILFENQYLVGDIVQIGDATGRVEAISIRHTQLRDEQGKLFIIPNGQIKTVINYSKGYANAVVDIKVPTTQSLDAVMRDMAEAGRRLRQARREVLGDTILKGLIDLTPTEMVIRAVTKVQPGTHQQMQQEYRKHLKAVFDQAKTPMLAA